jgi:SAM-dependent methyltransferase
MAGSGREIGMFERRGPCLLCGGADYRVLGARAKGTLKRCTRCGLVTAAATLPVGAIKEHYRGSYGEDWLRRSPDEHRRELFARILQEILKRRTPGSLLDVGCGRGFFLHQAAQSGWKVTGVEISPIICRLAQEELGLNVFQGELAEARFPEAAFDVVTFLNSLDHFDNPLEQLRGGYRALRPGGLVVVRVPNFLVQYALRSLTVTFGSLFGKRGVPGLGAFHLYNFSPRTLKGLLEKVGFHDVEVRNSWPSGADLSRSLGPRAAPFVQGVKLLLSGTAQALFQLSGGEWVWGASVEAYGKKP